MGQHEAIAIVQMFHRYLNDRAIDCVLALAAEDIRVGGPRGVGVGRKLLEEWVGHATSSLTPGRWFHRGDTVVVEQRAIWRDRNTGTETGAQTVAMAFTVREGYIVGIARYGFLGEAVNDADMDESHEIAPPE